MRLGIILMHITKKNPNGHLTRGKYRLVKPVFPDVVQKMKNDFKIEEENMFFLRHPYLTAEQSEGHAKSLGLPQQKFGDLLNAQRLKFKPNVVLEERLGHLRHSEPWD